MNCCYLSGWIPVIRLRFTDLRLMTGLKCCLCRKNQNGKWNFSGTVFPVEKFQKLWSMLENQILSMMGNIRTAGIPMRG